jgi:glycosyltransferase involved in cell wall biosynthesis
VPVVGSYHTELGPYALHLTRDVLVSQAIDLWVDWFYRRCDVVLAPTSAVAESLRARGYPSVELWGRGVDTSVFRGDRRSEELRRTLLDGGSQLILSVGRISHEKRLSVLLDAFAQVRAGCPQARLLVVGDGPAREELELSAPPDVRFLGELRGVELANVYAAADVFCFPSTTDTFGQVMLEAAASGLPVVAAATGGASELVAHGETGLLVRPDDAAALAAALTQLLDDGVLCERLGAEGLVRARRRSWADAHNQLLQAYRSLRPHEATAEFTLVHG